MARESAFEKQMRRRDNLAKAEASGQVADSHEVRLALVMRMHAGELTLEQVQAELKAIKRGAAKRGLTTREKAYRS